LIGGASGGEGMLRRNFASFATNSGGMVPGQTSIPYMGYQKGRAWTITTSDVELLQQSFPEMKAIIPTFQKRDSSFKYGKNSFSGKLLGAGANYTDIVTPKYYAGRFLNQADDAQERRVAVIGKKVATQLFPDNPTPLGKIIEVNGVSYSVIGIIGDTSEIKLNGSMDEMVVIPASTFRRSNGYGDKVDFVMFVAKDNENLADIIPLMKRVLYRRHNIHPNDESALWSINIAEQFKQIDKLFTGIDILALFIGLSTLLAGIIGIGNIMWVIVKERTQEIGIRRAIGAKPSDIVVQVLSEGTVLTIIAGLAGMIFAVGVLGILQHINNPPDTILIARFQMTLGKALSILATFSVLGILAGLIPSVKAMKIKPIEAINSK
ncbi:MAG: ABC transporter permease, partial [Muribaculaceae bacterium]|nr:ABC transporter permease [Muribaculaceae bacterium]